ncbi:MAG: aldo/keto reductase [Myxococcales bacterium]|nr:aldo/keto reductase [Myxococcales bacterium]
MDTRNLGKSGLKVPTLCLGTMTFGEADEKSFMHQVGCDQDTAFAIMDRALEAGAYFWDTADVYGQDGLTERVIGKWFTERKRRNDVILATKCRFRMADGPLGTGASRRRIVDACEASLKRLQTDRIDLYQIHMQDIETPEEETLRALDDLVRQGKVLYTGASNYAAYRLADSLWTSRTEHLGRFVSLQTQYSLVERSIEREHVPLCREHGLGILPWSPLAGGFLTGKYRREGANPEGTRLGKWKEWLERYNNEEGWAIIDAMEAIAKEHDATVSQVALAWLIHKPQVTSVIFGARTVAQLEDNLKAAELKLSSAQVAALDEVSGFRPGYPYEFIARIQKRW